VFAALWVQTRALAPLLATLYGAAAAALLAAVAASRSKGISFGTFTRDPTAVLEDHPFVGALSNVGVLVWCAAATLCLFTWLVTRRRAAGRVSPWFFLASGLLLAVLLADDLFLIHETVGPRYLGLDEERILAGYVLLMLCWLVLFWRTILATEYVLLVLAAGFSAVSIAIDHTWDSGRDLRYLLEDGFKLLAIVGWLGYFGRICYRELTGR
jgi:hypothetical protein